MKIITRQSLANTAAKRWKDLFLCNPEGIDPFKKGVFNRLEALGPNPPPDEVDRIVGSGAWTDSWRVCGECAEVSDRLVEVVGMGVCLKCLKKAVALFGKT